jgi:hypothetical protein
MKLTSVIVSEESQKLNARRGSAAVEEKDLVVIKEKPSKLQEDLRLVKRAEIAYQVKEFLGVVAKKWTPSAKSVLQASSRLTGRGTVKSVPKESFHRPGMHSVLLRPQGKSQSMTNLVSRTAP